MGDKTWEDVVHECERILGCTDRSESPLVANLPNLVRDLKHGISPSASTNSAMPTCLCESCENVDCEGGRT